MTLTMRELTVLQTMFEYNQAEIYERDEVAHDPWLPRPAYDTSSNFIGAALPALGRNLEAKSTID